MEERCDISHVVCSRLGPCQSVLGAGGPYVSSHVYVTRVGGHAKSLCCIICMVIFRVFSTTGSTSHPDQWSL